MTAPDGFSALTTQSVATTPTGSRFAPATLAPETVAILQASRAAEAKNKTVRRWQRIERMILLPILLLVIVGLFNVKMGQVQGRSMSPTYETGDKLLLLKSYKAFSPVKVGDIVVVKLKRGQYKGEEWVKRVVFVQNAQCTAKWEPTIQTPRNPHVPLNFWFSDFVRGEQNVPANHVMVMGDNYDNSTDSRDPQIGAISPDEIEGKVIQVWTSENNYSQSAL